MTVVDPRYCRAGKRLAGKACLTAQGLMHFIESYCFTTSCIYKMIANCAQ